MPNDPRSSPEETRRRELAKKRAEAEVRPLIAALGRRGLKDWERERLEAVRDYILEVDAVEEIAVRAKVNRNSVRHWTLIFRRDGVDALIRNPPQNRRIPVEGASGCESWSRIASCKQLIETLSKSDLWLGQRRVLEAVLRRLSVGDPRAAWACADKDDRSEVEEWVRIYLVSGINGLRKIRSGDAQEELDEMVGALQDALGASHPEDPKRVRLVATMDYLLKMGTSRVVADRIGSDEVTVRRWGEAFRCRGVRGLLAYKSKYRLCGVPRAPAAVVPEPAPGVLQGALKRGHATAPSACSRVPVFRPPPPAAPAVSVQNRFVPETPPHGAFHAFQAGPPENPTACLQPGPDPADLFAMSQTRLLVDATAMSSPLQSLAMMDPYQWTRTSPPARPSCRFATPHGAGFQGPGFHGNFAQAFARTPNPVAWGSSCRGAAGFV